MQKVTKSLMVVGAGVFMIAGMLSSCSKSKNNNSLPSIGGYNSSNDVASANLVAHWTFDGTMNESKSNTAPTKSSNVTFTASGSGVGGKGQAALFAKGYAVYPTIAALSGASALPSFTVSAWVQTIANNGSTVSCLFALSSAVDSQKDWNDGPIEMYLETANPVTKGDTLLLHTAFATYSSTAGFLHGDNINNGDTIGVDHQVVIAGPTTWVHYVATYDATTSDINIYANGKIVSNYKYAYRSYNGAGLGPINMIPPTQVVLGSFANSTVGFPNAAAQSWQGLFTGTLDELRVYNKALSASDISYLYQLESAGR